MNGSDLLRSKRLWSVAFFLVIGLGAWAFWKRGPLTAWYVAGILVSAPDDDFDKWLDSLAPLGPDAATALLPYLHAEDARTVAGCGRGLAELVRRWGSSAPATRCVVRAVVAQFPSLPSSGKQQALLISAAALTPLQEAPPDRVLAGPLVRLLESDAAIRDETCRPAALLLAIRLLSHLRPADKDYLATCRVFVDAGLADGRPECRADAARLAAAPEVHMLDKLPRLVLGPTPDTSPEVRRAALVLIGQRDDLAPTEDLLPLLHESSAEIRLLCEQILRSRGLTAAQIELARLMTDPRATVRAQVPAKVLEVPDLDTRVWLDRLSRDPSPAVRAAVVRVVDEAEELRLRERVHEMSVTDPSPTVRELARYYLSRRARR